MKPKIIAILPAYQAEHTLTPFFRSLPKEIFDEIILSDDCSSDKTYEIAKRLVSRSGKENLSVFRTPENLGYGGNMKFCLSKALERNADVIVELHPDGEYGTDGIGPGLRDVEKGAKLVLGDRFIQGRPKGMYLWKYLGTKVLTYIDNLLLGSEINDLHQGFRVYTKELLKNINYKAAGDSYIFSFEIIVQSLFKSYKVSVVPVSSSYSGKKRGAGIPWSILYSLKTFEVLFFLILAKLGFKTALLEKPPSEAFCPNCQISSSLHLKFKSKYNVYFCSVCKNGFIYPLPKKINIFYPESYWTYQGLVGALRGFLFNLSQKRRKDWIMEYFPMGAEILDVGAGEGNFAEYFDSSFRIFGIEAPFARVKSQKILKKDFLFWNTRQKFDAICFWESLEHVPFPQKYLDKANTLLKKDGLLFVECPNYASIESKLFGKNWFHLDPPRHFFHFTKKGLVALFTRCGFETLSKSSILAFEYAPAGFILSLFGKKAHPFIVALFFFPALVLEFVLFILDQSPIMLAIAKKK